MKWLLLSLSVILCCCSKKVETTQPVVQHITESVYASGIVKSKNQYQVFSSVNGIISEIRTREGAFVEKGEIIITLANEVPKLNVENATILSDYSTPELNQDKLNQLALKIEVTKEKMFNDSLLLERQRNLWKDEIGTRNQLEQTELAFENSRSEHHAAVLMYRELKKQILLTSRQSSKQLQISKALADDYSIRTKQSGIVYHLLKEIGEMVTTQTPVAIIGDATEFIIELRIDEYDIAKIKAGQHIFITLDSYKGQIFEAQVSRIIPIMNENSRAFTVEGCFIKQPPKLYPHLTVQGNILISAKENALTIPRNFLVGEDEVLLKDGKKKKVVTGLKDYQWVEIISGLSKDDMIRKPANETRR